MTLKSAQQSATSLSKETPTVPVDQLPADLLALLEDAPQAYKILGFDTGVHSSNQHRLDGEIVYPHYEVLMPFISPNQQIDYWPSKSEMFGVGGKKEAKHRFAHEVIEETAWFAVVIGNAVICESDLKAAGYPASAGSASYVKVRAATQSEMANYTSPS